MAQGSAGSDATTVFQERRVLTNSVTETYNTEPSLPRPTHLFRLFSFILMLVEVKVFPPLSSLLSLYSTSGEALGGNWRWICWLYLNRREKGKRENRMCD
jgi:hypothetical protein